MDYQIKVDKLKLHNTKANYHSHIYISPDNKAIGAGLGRLFIIVEAKSREKKIPSILNQIVEELSEYYFHSPTKNSEAALETTCQYFNENIYDITGKDSKWIRERMSVLIATLDDNQLILSAYNNIKLWLLRDNKIHDVTAGQSSPKKDSKSKKIVNQLISGQLDDGDVLLLTNSAIFDYFSDEKIKKTLTTLAPTQACAFFKNTLVDLKTPVDFSTVVVKINKQKAREDTEEYAKQEILASQHKTAELSQAQPSLVNRLVRNLSGLVKKGIQKTRLMLKDNFYKLKNKQKDKSQTQAAQQETEQATDSILISLKKLIGLINKYKLALLILIIIIAFLSSLLLVNRDKKEHQNIAEFNNNITLIEDKLNSVEAALIYKDKNKAQELIGQARQIYENIQIPEDQNFQNKYQELGHKINNQFSDLYNIEEIQNLTKLADLPAQLSPSSNIILGPKNILYFAAGSNLYKVNSQNQGVDKIAETDTNILKIKNFNKDRLILITQAQKFWFLDINNFSVRKLSSVNQPSQESQIQDFDIYSENIYTLDNGLNNIYKYNYSQNQFDEPQTWLEDEVDIDDNKYIAINGSIWLSGQDSKVYKFFRGRQEIFAIKGNYKKISVDTVVIFNEKIDNMYLLDKDNNTILIANQNGEVQRQFLADKIGRVTSIYPNTEESELYLLTNEKVIKFSLD